MVTNGVYSFNRIYVRRTITRITLGYKRRRASPGDDVPFCYSYFIEDSHVLRTSFTLCTSNLMRLVGISPHTRMFFDFQKAYVFDKILLHSHESSFYCLHGSSFQYISTRILFYLPMRWAVDGSV